MNQMFFGKARILQFNPSGSAPGPATRMTKFTFIDGTSQSYDVQTIDQQWLVREHFCEILSPAVWVKTNQSDWNFYSQPAYDNVTYHAWIAQLQRGSDINLALADGDEDATSLHFSDGVEIDVYAEKRSVNWLKKITKIELGENATLDETALAGLEFTPIYSGNGGEFSQWTILRDGEDVTSQINQPYFINNDEDIGWSAEGVGNEEPTSYIIEGNENSTSLIWYNQIETGEYDDEDCMIYITVNYTATRVKNQLLGYTIYVAPIGFTDWIMPHTDIVDVNRVYWNTDDNQWNAEGKYFESGNWCNNTVFYPYSDDVYKDQNATSITFMIEGAIFNDIFVCTRSPIYE